MSAFIHSDQDTVDGLMQHYGVDVAHAQHVARLAVGLFDFFQPMHRLSTRARDLLQAGALLHNVGMSVDEPAHHLAGRDIIIAAPLQAFDPSERAMLACMAAFHRKPVDADAEPLMQALSGAQREQTLMLSTILRVADGLDYSQTQTTQLEGLASASPDQPEVCVSGPHSHEDVARALKKADLWNSLFPPLHIHIVSQHQGAPGIALSDTLACAGRRMLRYQMEQLSTADWCVKENEWPTRSQVHQLRMAARRLRSTLRIFRPYYKAKAVQPVADGLHALSAALSPAREQDVTLRALQVYQQAADEVNRASIQPVADLWQQERERAYVVCAQYLGGEQHQAWLQGLADFVQSEAVDRAYEPGKPFYLRHALDVIMTEHIAGVRAYDVLPDVPAVKDIHHLRIAVKRLRYVCEGLREVLLAERVEQILNACAAAQGDYGALIDAHLVARRALYFVAMHRAADQDAPAIHVALALARAQQQIVAEHLAGWRLPMESLLML
jgi:CHAD domain-containing protein